MQSPPDRTARALRASAWTTFAFAAWRALWLPMPLYRNDGGWVFEYGTVLQVAVILTVAVLLWRGSRIAGAVAGLWGAWQVALLVQTVVRVLDGTAAAMGTGSVWLVGALTVLPFAIFWLRGGLAVLREWRRRDDAAPVHS